MNYQCVHNITGKLNGLLTLKDTLQDKFYQFLIAHLNFYQEFHFS